jgi:Xaa-Pro aminopeptidase
MQVPTTNRLVRWDTEKLDELLDAAGIDVLVVSSRHNLRFLLDGYEFFLYALAPPIGLSRYQPVLAIPARRLDEAFYIGVGNEAWGMEVEPLWVPEISTTSWTTRDVAHALAVGIERRGLASGVVGYESAFLAADTYDALRRRLPALRVVDASPLLEELRAVKRPDELECVRAAGEGITAAMLATFAEVSPGMSKREIVERFRTHVTALGCTFEYCLIAVGSDLNRAPSGEPLRSRSILSLDSGAEAGGFIGDMARMAIDGEPTPELVEALERVDLVQCAARAEIKPGGRAGDVYAAGLQALGPDMGFLAHGMGRVTHEVPRVTSAGSPPYPAAHADRPLEPGMVISVETHVADAKLGFIKLEDALIVTEDGHEAIADVGRGWNVIGD